MEMEEDIKTLSDYLHMARRRKYLIILPILFLLPITVIVALALPPIYRSEATILIEQQYIPSDFVKSTVTSLADERIKQIEQSVMTVEKVNKIIDEHNLYESFKTELTKPELADEFRKNTQLTLVHADVIKRGRINKATLAFTLSFNHKNAVVAQKITSELVTLYLNENIRNRTERAEETTLFLKEEAEKFKIEIQKIENQIAEYKEKYRESLPELLTVNLSSINRIETELQQLDFKEKMLNERKITLRTQLTITNPSAINASGVVVGETLPVLQAQYRELLSKYLESHPKVKAIKRKIDNYDVSSTELSNKAENTLGITNPVYLQLKSEMDIAQIELNNLHLQKNKLKKKLQKLELRVSQTHQVERGYYDLMRDLDNHKEKYKELKGKALEARLSQTLEEEQKAEKFSLLEPARVPTKPDKPNRIKILAMGFVVSIGVGIGLGFLAETLDRSIRGYKTLTLLTGVEPLAVIPYIENDEDLVRSRKNKVYFSILSGVFIVAVILAIHFFYMSLDLLWSKTWHRIGMF